MEHGLLEQGRLVKESAGAMFYDPAALVAFCRFNFLTAASFHPHAARGLERGAPGGGNSGCQRRENGGLPPRRIFGSRNHHAAALLLRKLEAAVSQGLHGNIGQPRFEQLLALRADLEEAVARGQSGAPSPAASTEQRQPGKRSTVDNPSKPAEPAAPTAAAVQVSPANAPSPKQPKPSPAESSDSSKASSAAASADKAQQPAADAQVPPAGALEKEKCLESIWEQLIAAPPSRGRSMSTVVLQDTKVLLSSWEVAAFVAEGDQEAEDLRRAVVARALLAVAMDQRKRSGDLSRSLQLSRSPKRKFPTSRAAWSMPSARRTPKPP